jgi:hypothetical protein
MICEQNSHSDRYTTAQLTATSLIILETPCATLSPLDVFERAMQKENKDECCIQLITKEKILLTNNVSLSMISLHISNFSLQIKEEQYYRSVICLAPNISTHGRLCVRACA